MTSCAIMQPTYLPWCGYFNLIASVDKFVLLDDVQFERRSWQSANRILKNGRIEKLTVPVDKQPRSEKLKNITIDHSKDWAANHLSAIQSGYPAAVGLTDIMRVIFPAISQKTEYLADLTSQLIGELAKLLEIRTPIIRASSLDCGGGRSEHLAEICRAIQASDYVSPLGSRQYLEIDRFSEMSGVRLHYQSFDPQPYDQAATSIFVSHLSVVDVVANCGAQFAKSYVLRDNL